MCYLDTCFLPTSLWTPFSFCKVFIQLQWGYFLFLFLIHLFPHIYVILHPSITLSFTHYHLGSCLSLHFSSCYHNPKLPAKAERMRSPNVSPARPGQASSSFLAMVKLSSSQPAICSCLTVGFSDSMWIWNYTWEGAGCSAYEYVGHRGGRKTRNGFGVWGMRGAELKRASELLLLQGAQMLSCLAPQAEPVLA